MAVKSTGLSRDLIIHPGETLRELLEDRNMTQKEIAARTGFSEKHVSQILNGKVSITAKFAAALEVVFGVNAKFWLNLQDNYDLEIMEYNAHSTVSDAEISILTELKGIIKYMKDCGLLLKGLKKEDDVIQLRKVLSVSNLTTIPSLSVCAAFRGSSTHKVNLYVLFAWIRLCEIFASEIRDYAAKEIDVQKLKDSIPYIKSLMFRDVSDIKAELERVFSECGIKLCIVKHFTGAPVQGFIERTNSGDVILCMTIRQAFADIFWFTLFHEIAHIIYGDISARFIDFDFTENEAEKKADEFAANTLINPVDFAKFVKKGDFNLDTIKKFASYEKVMPYVVIGRLQKEKRIPYTMFTGEKVRYVWVE